MVIQQPVLEPIHSPYRFRYLSDEQLTQLQEATLEILETVGVRFPSEKALAILSGHGANVDKEKQIVKFPRDLVQKSLKTMPRYFTMGAREITFDLHLKDGVTYFTTDGCGVETVDLETGNRRPSCKADVAMMAHVADYLSSMAFYWPMVSAQDYGRTAPLHEMDASWNNTIKHIQSETIMGEIPARYAVEMGTVIAGSREELRRRPNFSLVVCTIAPLSQDKDGIEGGLVMAEAGIPVGFLAMPTLGTTAPATLAGALAMGDAEVISAAVLFQLAYPGCPIFHSMMHAWADPRTGAYISYPLDGRARHTLIETAHHWGMPALGGCFGTDSRNVGTWQSAVEAATDLLIAVLVRPEIVTGIGLSETYTLLYPEQIILDNDIYHRVRHALMQLDINEETLALDTIRAVGPGGQFLSQKHTRQHMPTSLVRAITHELDENNKYRDPLEVARLRLRWILENYHPEPLEQAKQQELNRILAAADKELS